MSMQRAKIKEESTKGSSSLRRGTHQSSEPTIPIPHPTTSPNPPSPHPTPNDLHPPLHPEPRPKSLSPLKYPHSSPPPQKKKNGVGASLSALPVSTLVWEAGERKPTRLLVATLVWEPRAGGGGGGADPPFLDDDPERTRKETARQTQHQVSNQT